MPDSPLSRSQQLRELLDTRSHYYWLFRQAVRAYAAGNFRVGEVWSRMASRRCSYYTKGGSGFSLYKATHTGYEDG